MFCEALTKCLSEDKGRCAISGHVVDVELEYHTPLVFYRPGDAGKLPFLKISAIAHSSLRKISSGLETYANSGGKAARKLGDRDLVLEFFGFISAQ